MIFNKPDIAKTYEEYVQFRLTSVKDTKGKFYLRLRVISDDSGFLFEDYEPREEGASIIPPFKTLLDRWSEYNKAKFTEAVNS